MNSEDWNNGMVRNMEWEARKAAQLDAIYEQERAKYASSTTQHTLQNFNKSNDQNNNVNSDRLARLEARIDKLYEMFGNMKEQQCTSCDGLFVIANKGANVFSPHSITLTDKQFEMLMSKLIDG